MDVIKFILVFIRNRRGICGDALNGPVMVCGSSRNIGLVSGSSILRRLSELETRCLSPDEASAACVCSQIYGGAKKDKALQQRHGRTDAEE